MKNSLNGFGILILATGLIHLTAHTSTDESWVAHEWGTYTSVQGSDGGNLAGLDHGDEALPSFVHCPLGGGYRGCLSGVPSSDLNPELAVTQRLETPVIYFYSEKPRPVQIDVQFPKGLFSEWYPAPESFTPDAGYVTAIRNGSISWKADVHTESLSVPDVEDDSVWAPSRKVNANYISSQGENERFIFYRGVGNFDPPFKTESLKSGKLQLTNYSSQKIASAFLLRVSDEKGDVLAFHSALGLLVR